MYENFEPGILVLVFSMLIMPTMWQINCDITPGNDTIVPYGDSLQLAVEYSDTLQYLWLPGEETSATIYAKPTEYTTYFVYVYNADSTETCSSMISIDVEYPPISVEFEQLKTGCPGGDCIGQVRAQGVGGEEPYLYEWDGVIVDPGDSSLALGLCKGNVNIKVTDAIGSSIDTFFTVDVFRAPQLEIFSNAPDSADGTFIAYIQDPTVQFFFNNLSQDTLPLDAWLWNFGDETTSDQLSPYHTYGAVNEYMISMKGTFQDGKCDTTVLYPLNIRQAKMKVANVFTPNSDGRNDTFIITDENSTEPSNTINMYYISNEVAVYNRWGQKVYERKDYENDWDGDNLSDGVYYYIVKCYGEYGDDIFRGSVTIIRSRE